MNPFQGRYPFFISLPKALRKVTISTKKYIKKSDTCWHSQLFSTWFLVWCLRIIVLSGWYNFPCFVYPFSLPIALRKVTIRAKILYVKNPTLADIHNFFPRDFGCDVFASLLYRADKIFLASYILFLYQKLFERSQSEPKFYMLKIRHSLIFTTFFHMISDVMSSHLCFIGLIKFSLFRICRFNFTKSPLKGHNQGKKMYVLKIRHSLTFTTFFHVISCVVSSHHSFIGLIKFSLFRICRFNFTKSSLKGHNQSKKCTC